ncbi:MAG: type II toxin-antitoxin system RelE/ParE family toxin [Terriglobales bacterium]
MKIIWSPEAAADFAAIVRYIREDNAAAAQRVARSVYQHISQLKSFPNQGRPGRMDGTRELVFPPLPFVVVYRVKESVVEIVRMLHGAQRWP